MASKGLGRGGRSDLGRRRIATRAARQRGCYIYIPAQVLQQVGIDPYGPTPEYRVWGDRSGGVTLRLYKRKVNP